jgi:phage tail sheath protein FI
MRGVPGSADWLGERLTLIGDPSGLGHRLLSDATTSQSVAWRPGGVSRTVDIVLRASRALGQEQMFLGNGPALWAAIRNDLETYLERLRVAGALDGSPAEAYGVRCGADTMRQVDIDQGRLIVEIDLNPAQPVGWITVTLALGLDAQPVAEAA